MSSLNQIRKEFRKFKPETNFVSDFFLLPFTFRTFNNFEIIANEVGDIIKCSPGTAALLADEKYSEIEDLDRLILNMIVGVQNDLSVIETLANRVRHKSNYDAPSPTMHIVVLTLRCDHTCKYCQVSRVSENKEAYDLSEIHTSMVIDAILTSEEGPMTIEFQGGESLLAFDRLKDFVEIVKNDVRSSKYQLTWVVCTSLSTLTKEHVLFFKQHNINISSSLDGPSDIHDGIRKIKTRDSYQRVLSGISLINKHWSIERLSALMTTTINSFSRAKCIVDEYVSHGFRDIFLRPISPYGFARKNKDSKYEMSRFIEFYKEGLEYIISLNKRGIEIREFYTIVLLKGLLTPHKETYVDLMSPIGAGRISVVYDYDGYVYISDEARMLAQNGDFTFRLGHISQGLPKLLSGNVNKITQEKGISTLHAACSNCVYRNACGADPLFHHATQDDSYGNMAKSSFCSRNMDSLDYLVEMSIERPNDFNILKNWLA